MSNGNSLIETHNLVKKYGEKIAVNNVSFATPEYFLYIFRI